MITVTTWPSRSGIGITRTSGGYGQQARRYQGTSLALAGAARH